MPVGVVVVARRRETAPVLPPGVRPFTAAELARIRELTARPLQRQHPNPVSVELDALHAAAGRRRGFTLWELGGGPHDAETAYREELDGLW